jgi:hypothetical protein
MMGQQPRTESLFYYFRLEEQIPETRSGSRRSKILKGIKSAESKSLNKTCFSHAPDFSTDSSVCGQRYPRISRL